MSMTTDNITPLGNHILVKRISEQTEGTIVLPGKKDEKSTRGLIIACGPGALTDGKREEMPVKAGQTVLFAKYAGTEIDEGNEELLIIKSSDILAIIESK